MASDFGAARSGPIIDIAEVVDSQKFSRLNVLIILLGWIAIFGDGYDITDISYVVPELVKEWGVPAPSFSLVFSSSLASYAIGAVFFGWLSDKIGRRYVLMAGCLTFGIFSLLSMFARDPTELFIARFLTGIGLGGTVPNVIATAAESAPRRIRAMVVILTFSGTNLGGASSGWVAAWLMPIWGWQVIFFVGFLIPAVAALLIYLYLPESIKFMTLQGGREAEIAKLVRIMRPDMNVPDNARFILQSESKVSFRPWLLFQGSLKYITTVQWFMVVCAFMTNYFLLSWMNFVFREAGMSASDAAIASSMYNFIGMFGGWAISLFVDRFGVLAVAAWGIIAAITVSQVGTPGLTPMQLSIVVGLAGFGVQGLLYGLNSMPGLIYPTAFRANGIGWQFAVSRLGAVIGPIIGGQFLAMSLPVPTLFYMPVIPLAIGVALALLQARLCYDRFGSLRLDERPAAGKT